MYDDIHKAFGKQYLKKYGKSIALAHKRMDCIVGSKPNLSNQENNNSEVGRKITYIIPPMNNRLMDIII